MFTNVYKRMLNDYKCLITESVIGAAVVLHHQVLEREKQDFKINRTKISKLYDFNF